MMPHSTVQRQLSGDSEVKIVSPVTASHGPEGGATGRVSARTIATRNALFIVAAFALPSPWSNVLAATDTDQDGIFDAVEIGPDPDQPIDTDGDGVPNYRDTDSDNDGIPDAAELVSIYLPDSLCWDHNADGGRSFAATIGAAIVDEVVYADDIGFGRGFDYSGSTNEFVLSGAEAGTHIAARAEDEYAELHFRLQSNATLDAMSYGLAPIVWGASGAGNYRLAIELSEDAFASSHVVYDDGFINSPGDDYEYVYRPTTQALSAATDYSLRLYLFDEQNDYDVDDTLTVDDVCVHVTIDRRVIGDTDDDALPNHLDLDSDNDGIADFIEAGEVVTGDAVPALRDTDEDGTPDFLDLDSDNDGLSDALERGDASALPSDTDGDGFPDYRDTDADGDGLADALEVGPDPSQPLDSNADGVPDYLSDPAVLDSDADGIPDLQEVALARNGGDSDGDTQPDEFDNDADGDGLTDAEEALLQQGLPADTDADGIPDYLDLDSDNDGLTDAFETVTSSAGNDATIDTDGDGRPNHLDRDSDDDGLSDRFESTPIEATMATSPTASMGSQDVLLDENADGLADDIPADVFLDSDDDGLPNRLDTDSDNDGIDDRTEAESTDLNSSPLVISSLPDDDNNGVPNYLDGAPAPRILTGIDGYTGGCSIGGEGSSPADGLLALMAALSAFGLWLRLPRAQPALRRHSGRSARNPR